MKFESWRPGLLPAVVRFWNHSFAARRNFVPLTPERFRDRVLKAGEFDPRGFIVARGEREIAGAIHVGRRADRQGFIALLFVDPAHRKKGLGTRLWHRGLDAMRGPRFVTVMNPWENSFYGSSRGETPLWGTPWGIGVEWSDSASLKFLARKGHAPRSRAIQLTIDLRAPAGGAISTGLRGGRLRRETRGSFHRVTWTSGRARGGRVKASYFAPAAQSGMYGLYGIDASGASARSRSGLLAVALDEMRSEGGESCEVLSHPDLRPDEHQLYLEAGFTPVASWAVF